MIYIYILDIIRFNLLC